MFALTKSLPQRGKVAAVRLTDEVSASLFALSLGGALTNENHLNPCRDRRPRLSVICYILMFSRVVEGADPYRGIEKPFISSPPNGCANITREDASILRFAPWQVCFANIAPPLPRFVRERLFVRSRKMVRTTMRAIRESPLQTKFL